MGKPLPLFSRLTRNWLRADQFGPTPAGYEATSGEKTRTVNETLATARWDT